MVREYAQSIAQAERENWGYRRFRHQLAQFETTARVSKKVKRLLDQSKIPREFTLAALEQSKLPEKPRRQLPTLLLGISCVVVVIYCVLVYLGGGGRTMSALLPGNWSSSTK